MHPLGETIYLWRRERGLTQDELSRGAGISRPNLSRLEQGARDVTVGTLRRLAEALRVRPGWLVDGVPPEAPTRRRLSRESLDRIARWLTGGTRGGKRASLSREEREIARMLQSLMKRKLGLTKDYGRSLPRTAREERENLVKAKIKLSRGEMQNLLSRVNKISSLTQ